MKLKTLHRLRQQDRTELETMLAAINGAKNSLGRDECGDWTISGSRGTIRACEGKYSIYVKPGSAQSWTWTKKKLAAMTSAVSQDGDEEGILIMDRMPTPDEAAVLRDYVGIRQTHAAPAHGFQNAKEPD